MRSLNEIVQEAYNTATRAKEKVDILGLRLQKFGTNLSILATQVMGNSESIAHIIQVLQKEGLMDAPEETTERNTYVSEKR